MHQASGPTESHPGRAALHLPGAVLPERGTPGGGGGGGPQHPPPCTTCPAYSLLDTNQRHDPTCPAPSATQTTQCPLVLSTAER